MTKDREKENYHDAALVIAKYIATRAVRKTGIDRENYLRMAMGETMNAIQIEIDDIFANTRVVDRKEITKCND